MSRLARARTSLFGFAFILIAIPLWWRFHWNPAPLIVAAQDPGHAGSSDLAVDLIRAGLDAKALAAAGLSANTVTVLAQATLTHLTANPTSLSAADTAYAAARRESDHLKRLIESGHGSQDDVGNYQTQSATLAAATADRDAALAAIVTAATAGLSSDQKTALARIRANQTWKEAGVEFLVVERTEAQWVALRDALAAERIAAAAGDDLPEATQTLLATARVNESVAAAHASLGTNLAGITAAWNAATHN
jgi:hypothetical protein